MMILTFLLQPLGHWRSMWPEQPRREGDPGSGEWRLQEMFLESAPRSLI